MHLPDYLGLVFLFVGGVIGVGEHQRLSNRVIVQEKPLLSSSTWSTELSHLKGAKDLSQFISSAAA